MGFIDYAGAGVVCVTGGFAGISGSYCVGPRINTFDADEEYRKSKKKLQMLSKESLSKELASKRIHENELKMKRDKKFEQDTA